jgi:hypothetical protein
MQESQLSRERRREERHHLIHYLRIFDRQTGAELGNLVNINTSGIKIISSNPITEGVLLELRMDFPEEFEGRRSMEFDARSVWVGVDENPDWFAIGLKFINITAEDLELLKRLIEFYQD